MAVPPTNQPGSSGTGSYFGTAQSASAQHAARPTSIFGRPLARTAPTSGTRSTAINFGQAPSTSAIPAVSMMSSMFGARPSAPTNHAAVPAPPPIAAVPSVTAPVANPPLNMFDHPPPPPFEPFLITERCIKELFSGENFAQTITAGPPHQNESTEELRLADYEAGRGKPPFRFPQSFNIPAKGMVHLHLPDAQVQCRLQVQFPSYIVSCENLGDSVMVFEVGSSIEAKPQRFVIHEDIVRPVSDFVSLALSGEWKEASERKIPLPDDEPRIFRVYQSWLYTRRIVGVSCELLLHCYVFGEKFLDTTFKDVVIDCLLEVIARRRVFPNNMSGLIYKGTLEGSPLRRLLCELFAWCGTATWYDESPDAEMLADLATM
ncbi:hypothetical protein LTR17_011711 [Elasticomyces elasticus]|nr:hypothetical protein LTR17_011711 [Elasticomyces elasticus]